MRRLLIVILICLFLPIQALAVSYGKTGESTNFNGDVGVPSGSGYYINGVQVTSAILSDVASIAMLDENETVTGDWTFSSMSFGLDSDTTYAAIGFDRARDGDPTYNVSDDDKLGGFNFYGYHTNGYDMGASITAVVDGTPGDGDMPGRLEFLTSPDGTKVPVLRLEIDNAGNIKMGDGAWTNYINTTAAGVMTAEGAATITATNLVPTVEIDVGAHSVGFTLQEFTAVDNTTTIDWTLGNKYHFTFDNENQIFTFTPPTNPCTLMLTLIQDAVGSRTITWPDTCKWPGGVEGTLTTTANARDKVALDWDGVQYDCQMANDFR